MRRGVNLGNALEAPTEGEWGYRIEEDHLTAIADAGFDGVRLPVRWDAYANEHGSLHNTIVDRVAHLIEACSALDLYVQLDCHHYDALIADPDGERQRFLEMWRSISSLQHFGGKLLFEPFNEPNGPNWDNAQLMALQRDVVSLIREDRNENPVVLGPGNWQSIDALRDWRPPEGENIAVSVHYYEPHAFTHQGAEWLGDAAPTFDRDWGTVADRRQVRDHIGAAARWSREHGYAMQLGEFGVNSAVPVQQRAAWTRAVREACEAHGIGWCVWDFAGAFPIWDRERGAFIPLMRDALFS